MSYHVLVSIILPEEFLFAHGTLVVLDLQVDSLDVTLNARVGAQCAVTYRTLAHSRLCLVQQV